MKALLWIAGLYLPCVVVTTAMTGHLSRLGDPALLFFPFGDGPGLDALADYYSSSFGQGRRPAELFLEVTPFLYPLYLGLYRVIGVAGVQVLQVLMNVLSLWCVYVSVRSLTNRSMIAGLCTGVLAVTPSFSFLAFYALSENLCIVLVCLFMLCIVDHFHRGRQTSLYMATFIMTLLVCIKPVALFASIVLVVYTVISWVRNRQKRVWEPVAFLSPVLCQLIVSFMMTGSVAPASARGTVFGQWYFPVLYGQVEYGKFLHRKTPEGKEGLSRYPETEDKLMYVAKHCLTAIKTYLSLLIGQHLLAGSNFISAGIPDHAERGIVRFLQWWSAKLNRFFFCVHIVMLGLMACWVMSGRRLFSEKASLVCYGFAILLLLPMGLVYFQGDKYIILSEPLWLLSYGTFASRRVDEWSSRFDMTRLSVSTLKN
jgi:4-amino-4-deoxy-L-arabinose transferase-like glycosyltransferase